MSNHRESGPAPSSQSPEQIEAEIESQRDQLSATVDQLAARLDMKSRAQAAVASAKEAATTADGKPRPELLVGAGAFVAAGVAVAVWRLRR